MASTLHLRNRIKTAQNVSKTTKAMQMIAVSKLKRAQDTTLGSRPYVEKLSNLTQELSAKIDTENLHDYMKTAFDAVKTNDSDKSLLLIFSPDKGLCGGLVTNLSRELLQINKNENYSYITVGKKMENVTAKLKKDIIATFPFGTTLPSIEMVYPIERIINEYFLSKKVKSVKILYTSFSSFFSQIPRIDTILPITFQADSKESEKQAPYEIFEPQVKAILPSLLEHYLQMSIYQRLLESFLSEQAARMFAMQNATSNANEIIGELKLEYNKLRQTSITNEILDISSAALFTYA